jgi:hypothetical protein
MNVLNWLKSLFTRRGRALSMYRQGMRLATEHNHRAAIEEYTAAIELTGVPADVKAMALFNRGLVHMASGDYHKNVDDSEAFMAMDEVPRNVKTMPHQKRVKREGQRRRSQV